VQVSERMIVPNCIYLPAGVMDAGSPKERYSCSPQWNSTDHQGSKSEVCVHSAVGVAFHCLQTIRCPINTISGNVCVRPLPDTSVCGHTHQVYAKSHQIFGNHL